MRAAVGCLLLAVAGLILPARRTPPSAAAPAAVFPLQLSHNRRYLVDQDGTPFLIVADSPQALMSRLTEKDADSYFADREAHGFNTLGWINVACAGVNYPENRFAATPDGIRPFTAFLAGGSDYTSYDLTKPNEAYFVRLDHMLQLAAKHHFAVFLDPAETNGWLPTLRRNGMKAAYEYGEFLGRRYSHFDNLLWISGNDFRTWRAGESGALPAAAEEGIRPLVHTWDERDDDALVQAVARGIRAAAPRQLQTLELEPLSTSSFDDPAWIPLIDLNGTYTYGPTYLQMLHSYNQKPTAPTFLMEARYEFERTGDPLDEGAPSLLRKQAYWTMLSGGTGQFYGNGYIWPFKDGWRKNLDTDGVLQIQYWKDFFLALPWQNLIPDQKREVLVSGSGPPCTLQTRVSECATALAASSSDGSVAVVYIPANRTIQVNMAVLSHASEASWFDTSNGNRKRIGTFSNTGIREFTPPGKNHSGDEDWVLLLRSKTSD